MTYIKAILVDDEQDSRSSLANYISKYCPAVELLASCANIEEAQKAISRLQPNLVFLDIEMPFGNAFDLLETLQEIKFEIIFVTAFSQYAVQALNQSAAYYILKPIDIDELVDAVGKVKQRLEDKDHVFRARILRENLAEVTTRQQRITLPLIDGFKVVALEDILYCEAEDNFTRFHLRQGKPMLICRKLKYYEELLREKGFCRIHRSFLINLDYVQRYIKGKGGTVILQSGKQLQVANARKQAFLTQFSG